MPNDSIPIALLRHLDQGVLVFDRAGQFLFGNQAAQEVLGFDAPARGTELRAAAARHGGREVPFDANGTPGGVAVVFPVSPGAQTLAEQERTAILQALEVTHGRLAETARRLGISRTTLWRRLKAYGVPHARTPGD